MAPKFKGYTVEVLFVRADTHSRDYDTHREAMAQFDALAALMPKNRGIKAVRFWAKKGPCLQSTDEF